MSCLSYRDFGFECDPGWITGDCEGTVNWEGTSVLRRAGEGWIGVDLDGTLAVSTNDYRVSNLTEIGAPIPIMVKRVKKWLKEGRDVRIFTARANPIDLTKDTHAMILCAIREWCREHLGEALPIVYAKDWEMIELWDDSVVPVERDSGRVIGNVRSRLETM